MKKIWMIGLAGLMLVSALFASCGIPAPLKTGIPAVPQPVQPVATVQNINLSEAENTVKNTIALDYTKYTLSMINDQLTYQGQEYYQFLISDGKVALKPSVIVSKDNGEIYCYYPDRSVTEVYQDSVFKSKCL